jgi:hypothetical protein
MGYITHEKGTGGWAIGVEQGTAKRSKGVAETSVSAHYKKRGKQDNACPFFFGQGERCGKSWWLLSRVV